MKHDNVGVLWFKNRFGESSCMFDKSEILGSVLVSDGNNFKE